MNWDYNIEMDAINGGAVCFIDEKAEGFREHDGFIVARGWGVDDAASVLRRCTAAGAGTAAGHLPVLSDPLASMLGKL